MSNKKATKRALLTSITALAMCVVMLVGTTFAWFTDTTTANVNKIQAGKLDVALEMNIGTKETPKWVTAEKQVLNFRDKNGNTNVLWEPGATFNLDQIRVVNAGNLAIKYEVKVTGIKGSAKLLEVIDFSVVGGTLNGDSVAVGTLMPKGQTGDISDPITIQGKMKESANNDYQGLTLDGIAITVYATQNTYEYDSNDNTYDSGAFDALKDLYPVSNSVAKPAIGDAVINDADASGNKQTYQVTVPQEAMDTQASNISVTIAKSASADAKFTVAAGNELKQFDVTVTGIKNGNTADITVELFIGKGYTLGSSVDVQHLKSDGKTETLEGSYDNTTGFVTFKTTSFSPFAVAVPEMTAVVGEGLSTCYYDTLADAFAAAQDGDTITLLKSTTDNGIAAQKGFVLDFNGHTLKIGNPLVGSTGTETNAFQLLAGAGNVTFKNGTLTTEEAYILIQNYCNLTLDNMVLDGRNIPVHATYPDSVVRYTLSNNCGIVTINNSTIYAPETLGVAFDVYGGFGSYGDVTVKVDGNSVINGDIEVAHGDRAKNNNANTLLLEDCTVNGNILKSDGTLNFAGNVTLNGNVNVTENKDDVANRITVTGKTTLNLNGKIITPNDMGNNNTNFTALIVDADTTINAGVNGGIDTQKNGGYGINVRKGATLTINGGTYYGGGTAVQAQKGFVIINDGNFAVEPYSNPVYGYKFMLNCIDAAYKAGEAGFTVYGGTYTGFDPSNSDSENPRASFVPEGYTCTKTGENVWTVTKNA